MGDEKGAQGEEPNNFLIFSVFYNKFAFSYVSPKVSPKATRKL